MGLRALQSRVARAHPVDVSAGATAAHCSRALSRLRADNFRTLRFLPLLKATELEFCCGSYPYAKATRGFKATNQPPEGRGLRNADRKGPSQSLSHRSQNPPHSGRDPQQTPPGTPGRAPHKRNGRFPRQSPIAVISPRNHTSSYAKRTLLPTVTHRSTRPWYTGAANTYI